MKLQEAFLQVGYLLEHHEEQDPSQDPQSDHHRRGVVVAVITRIAMAVAVRVSMLGVISTMVVGIQRVWDQMEEGIAKQTAGCETEVAIGAPPPPPHIPQ